MSDQASLFDAPKADPAAARASFLAGQLGYLTAGDRKLKPGERAELERIALDALRNAQAAIGT